MIAPTKPVLPPYEKYIQEIKSIWDTCTLTNNGPKVQALKRALRSYADCPNLDLFVNGHSALLLALKALNLTGEAITSPFTFASTTNAIVQAGLTPIFVDIDDSYNIDPEKIESHITAKTSAIIVPHIFGIPCDVDKIQKIADKYNLRIIYDAAQAFGTKIKGKHIVSFGDVTMISFHAIKVFNSIEGGMLVYKDSSLEKQLALYRNFGIDYETKDVKVCGYNAKMNEFQAAMGLCNLPGLEEEITKRQRLAATYTELLTEIPGIKCYDYSRDIRYNYAYFPIKVAPPYSLTRDELWTELSKNGVITRKLYDKGTSDFSYYAKRYISDTPNAKKICNMALDLPLYGSLTEDDVRFICDIIRKNNA